MKGLGVLAFALVVFQGCVTSTIGGIELVKVDRPAEIVESPSQIVAPAGGLGHNTVFEDDNIRIEWVGSSETYAALLTPAAWSSLAFTLQNKTDSTMRIIWDDAVFVDASGENHRVMHEGVKFATKEQSQPPSIIVKGGTLTDSISPTSSVEWTGSGWAHTSFLGKESVGKTVKVLLPIQIGDKPFEYLFEFNVLAPDETKKGK